MSFIHVTRKRVYKLLKFDLIRYLILGRWFIMYSCICFLFLPAVST